MLRSKTIPVLVVLLSLAAIASITMLQARAGDARDAQLKLATLKNELTGLQMAPFKASARTGGSPAFARKLIDDGKQRVAGTLAELRRSSPVPSLAADPGSTSRRLRGDRRDLRNRRFGCRLRPARRLLGRRFGQGDGPHCDRARRGQRRVRPACVGCRFPRHSGLCDCDLPARTGVCLPLPACHARSCRRRAPGPRERAPGRRQSPTRRAPTRSPASPTAAR